MISWARFDALATAALPRQIRLPPHVQSLGIFRALPSHSFLCGAVSDPGVG
jgi:hypothetical protein